MAIKDKDGNVYKLRGPNPLVKNKSDWDNSKIKLINFDHLKEEIVKDIEKKLNNVKKNQIEKENKKEESKVIKPDDFVKDIADNEDKNEEKNNKIEIIEEKKENNEIDQIIGEKGVEFFCAPVIGFKKIVDELYGSSYKKPKYGTPFLFKLIIIDASDLQIQIWSPVELEKDSIIYKKNKQGGERWWKIMEIEEKTKGWLCVANTSDINPDFS
jgi:hypothetical protein